MARGECGNNDRSVIDTHVIMKVVLTTEIEGGRRVGKRSGGA